MSPRKKVQSVPLQELGRSAEQIRRDQWGRYLVVPPTGGPPVGFTRVTTVAKELDSGGGLAPWKAAMACQGLIMRRGLRAQWEALMAENNGDPWYASDAGKAECKRLVEECSAVGGANDRKEIGSALHAISALYDRGCPPTILTEETEADVKAYRTALALANVDIDPNLVEITVILDEWQVAGTFDRLVSVPGFELPVIADLKTGADLTYSWQSIAVQLAAYSRANAIYLQGKDVSGKDDVRVPMPDVDQEWGLVMWLDAGSAQLELFLVDLVSGWEAFEHSMWKRGWYKQKVSRSLTDHMDEQPDSLVPILQESLDAVAAEKAAATLPSEASNGDEVDDGEGDPPGQTDSGLDRAELQARIAAIGAVPDARAHLLGLWDAEMPLLHKTDEHTPEQLELIASWLTEVETHSMPFTHEEGVGRLLQMFPHSQYMTDNNQGA